MRVGRRQMTFIESGYSNWSADQGNFALKDYYYCARGLEIPGYAVVGRLLFLRHCDPCKKTVPRVRTLSVPPLPLLSKFMQGEQNVRVRLVPVLA